MGNIMLAKIALTQAARTIDELVSQNKEFADMPSVIAFRTKVQVLARELKTGD